MTTKKLPLFLLMGLLIFSLRACDDNHTTPTPDNANDKETAITIDDTSFPDAAFRDALSTKVDKDGDGQLSAAEIRKTDELKLSNCGITSLQGIEYFTALEELEVDGNQLTTFDLSKNSRLEELDCSYNQLTSLTLAANTALESLDCIGNQLTTLDLSKNVRLEELDCENNQLTHLDLSHNNALEELNCSSNQLTALDLSQNTHLEDLACNNNQLTTLDITPTQIEDLRYDTSTVQLIGTVRADD